MGDMADLYSGEFDDEAFEGRGREMVALKYERVLRESKKALYFEFPMDDELNNETCWLPKSQIRLQEGDKVVLVPEWLVAENELDKYQAFNN